MEPSGKSMRHFDEELSLLEQRLLAMGGLVEERLRLSVDALTRRDAHTITEVITGDQPVNAMHIEIDERAFTLLALH
jgi:phosphate transport system protein